jgi:hypothetical protein
LLAVCRFFFFSSTSGGRIDTALIHPLGPTESQKRVEEEEEERFILQLSFKHTERLKHTDATSGKSRCASYELFHASSQLKVTQHHLHHMSSLHYFCALHTIRNNVHNLIRQYKKQTKNREETIPCLHSTESSLASDQSGRSDLSAKNAIAWTTCWNLL